MSYYYVVELWYLWYCELHVTGTVKKLYHGSMRYRPTLGLCRHFTVYFVSYRMFILAIIVIVVEVFYLLRIPVQLSLCLQRACSG